MKQRVAFWDNYKGILIFLVVFGHFIYSYAGKADDSFVETLYIFIYTFHMPAFVFSSGYFSKSIRSRSTESALKMILCYLIFNTAMMLFSYLYLGSNLKIITPYYSYWYILSLVCWRLMITSLEKIKFLIPFAFSISLLLGYWNEFSNTFSIRRTIVFFFFFILGYALDKEKIEHFITQRTWKTNIAGFFVILIFIPGTLYIIQKCNITSEMTLMASYKNPTDIFIRMILLIIACVAIVALILTIPNRQIPLLSQFGKNSLLIYLAHRFVTIIFYKDLFSVDTYSRIYILYALIATFVTCIFFGNDFFSKKFNIAITSATMAIMDSDNRTGRIFKTLIIIIFIFCLLLRPFVTYFT